MAPFGSGSIKVTTSIASGETCDSISTAVIYLINNL